MGSGDFHLESAYREARHTFPSVSSVKSVVIVGGARLNSGIPSSAPGPNSNPSTARPANPCLLMALSWGMFLKCVPTEVFVPSQA
jgi:hypothetical protein